MRWTKIKNMMLIFLLAMNLFLLCLIAINTYKLSVIPEQVTDATVKVLNDSGFVCDKTILPKKYYNRSSLDATFYSASDLSELFFGRQVAFRTSDKSLVAAHDNATLTVYSNYFVYENGNKAHKASFQKQKDALKKLGIDMNNSVYDKKNNCFYKMHNQSNLFNMYIKADIDKNGDVCKITAQWPKKLTERNREKISFTQSIMKLKKSFPQGGKIEKIELGYNLRAISGEKFRFNPTWRVKVDGELKILD